MRAIALSTPFAVIGILSWRSCFKPEVCWDGKTWKKQAAFLLTQTGRSCFWMSKVLALFLIWILPLWLPLVSFLKTRCGYQTLKTAVFLERDPSLWHPKLHYSTNVFSRWWFQISLIFTSTWGNDPIWLYIVFSDGLKPPPSFGCLIWTIPRECVEIFEVKVFKPTIKNKNKNIIQMGRNYDKQIPRCSIY